MPLSQAKKRSLEKDNVVVSQCEESNTSSVAEINSSLNNSNSSNYSGKCRKKKRCDDVRFSDLESEFEDCDLEDAAALETKLRKVARRNSLTHDEMMKLLHKFVKNEHILALVTLKAEDELAKEKKNSEEQRAIIITETTSVPKLTRAKARELNKTPIIKLSSLEDQEIEPEIAALIKEDLHSDEEDEEYVFKEEDFMSDDDPNTTVSDIESSPRTPATPAIQFEDSPIKLSNDGCFKVPLSKKTQELTEELRIAARTRSKLCLEQTTIEDLQSEFVPPDVEEPLEVSDLQPLDEDWMQFLNDFSKPLNASLIVDDDDPINDPEYVAAEKESVDAEELRAVNISKKELSELVAELYDDLMSEGLFMESIDLDTSRKDDRLDTPNASPERFKNNLYGARQLDINKQQIQQKYVESSDITTTSNIHNKHVSDIQISTNNQHDYTFQSDAISTISTYNKQTECINGYNNNDNMALIPVAQSDNNAELLHNKTVVIDTRNLDTQPQLIAVPIPGQPNCFQLAKVVDGPKNEVNSITFMQKSETNNVNSSKNLRYSKPYEINYTCEYISVRRHIINEYIDKFKHLQDAQDNKISSTTTESFEASKPSTNNGFTQYQYDLMQQQLRIHIQQLTQNFVQTYCHPELWKLAPKAKELLLDLQEKSKKNVNFQVWNLEAAIEFIHNWQKELDQNTPENTELMNFLHHESTVTNHQSRQIPRFHPRILDCYLNSPVFMYPQYLPRMPFSSKPSIPIFSPVESYLIAMGLEKHLQLIYEKKEKITLKTTPLRVACKRLAKDTVCGKRYRRIWDHILYLQKVDYYNPIKYFFEHNKAPPVDHDPIWTFENNVVLPPKDRIQELPLVYRTYLQKKNEPPKPKIDKNKKKRKKSTVKVSDGFRNSYLEFVKEAVGQDLPIPQNIYNDTVVSSNIPLADADCSINFTEKVKHVDLKPSAKRRFPQSLTINVNYVYGGGLDNITTSTNHSLTPLPRTLYTYECPKIDSQNLLNSTERNVNLNSSNNSLPDSTFNTVDTNVLNNTAASNDIPAITYNFDWRTKTLQPAVDTTITKTESGTIQSQQCTASSPNCSADCENTNSNLRTKKEICYLQKSKISRASKKLGGTFKLHKKVKRKALAYREKRLLQRRCEELITTYSFYLNKILFKFKEYPLLQYYYRYFKALELYTNLLKGLKNICAKNCSNMSNSSNNSPSNLKRSRNSNTNTEDDNSPSSTRQVRKLNRQEENFRHMLMPDTPEEANRKDAIYAFNFYEKVEEAFKASNRAEDCKKFNTILKSFDPKKDKVSDLYYKLENLFLPDHPELAQVFLTFLLPSEAAEVGKFFEHFMINNMTTFINKLNIYFNKQPAQIRKIYNCLNDLAEDPDVTMKKVETKIVPLLKGNQFLVDWFMQQFPQNTPPERLFSNPEQINFKDQQANRSGEYMETITDIMDSPTNDQQQQSCQLRYINGRIFYGSKMLLPAKLSFMAISYKNKPLLNEPFSLPSTSVTACVHGIREYGEKRLQAAAELTSAHNNTTDPPICEDQEKSEEEEVSKALVIDITGEEEDSCSSVEPCDEITLRSHATRLNPTVYSSTCYSTANATSTPNLNNHFQTHHSNAKKTCLNFNEEAKLSPRKNATSSLTSTQINLTSPLASVVCNSALNSKDKRKSPTKKTKSPSNSGTNSRNSKLNNAAVQPMVVIHETNSAIQCAKRLKSLIDEGQQSETATEEVIDSKDIIQIVARTKKSLQTSENLRNANQPPKCEDVKQEKSKDLEFLTENTTLSASPFPSLRIETDSNEEDACNVMSLSPLNTQPTPRNDEDCKIDIATSLSNNKSYTSNCSFAATPTTNKPSTVLPLNAAWTRDEDKVILIEMKLGSLNTQELYQRIVEKLPNRTICEITSRHHFLMDFLSKLQGN